MGSGELKERFSASEAELNIGTGSLSSVKKRAAQRQRRQRVAAGASTLVVLALIVISSQFFLRGNATTVDVADGGSADDVWTTTGTLTSDDFTYAGSFSIAPGPENEGFGFGGFAIAYNPAGSGSLFLSGLPEDGTVAEVSIPELAPHDGARGQFSEAEILQPLTDITDGRGDAFVGTIEQGGFEHFRIGGLEVVDGRLHWTAWRAFDVTNDEIPGHGHSSLDFSDLDVEGPWSLSNFDNFVTAGYVFDVPRSFANEFLDGQRLISGYQLAPGDSDTSAGPPFIAFSPPDSAIPESRIDALEIANFLPGESRSTSFDERAVFPGGEWVSTSDGRHGVVLAGNSMQIDQGSRCERGSTTDVAAHGPQLALYDPADLAAAATGSIEPSNVEPESIVSLEADFIPTCGVQVGGISFDEENGRLFVAQQLVTANESGFSGLPVVHAFDVR